MRIVPALSYPFPSSSALRPVLNHFTPARQHITSTTLCKQPQPATPLLPSCGTCGSSNVEGFACLIVTSAVMKALSDTKIESARKWIGKCMALLEFNQPMCVAWTAIP